MTITLLAGLLLALPLQDDPKTQLRTWSKGVRAGDLKPAYAALQKLAKDDDASTKAAAALLKEEEKRLAPAMKDLQTRIDAIFAKTEKRGDTSEKEWAKIDRAITELNDALCLLQEQLDTLARFPRDLELFHAWQTDGPVLKDGDAAIRSFEYFGTTGDWENAAKCLASGNPEEARAHFKTIAAARKASARAPHWEFCADPKSPLASLTTFMREKDSPWKSWPNEKAGQETFFDTTAVLRFEVNDDAIKIDTVWKGNTVSPAK